MLKEIVRTVRRAFGRPDMDYQDIYDHVVSPDRLLVLIENKSKGVLAMGGYSTRTFSGEPSLIVDGVAIAPEMQGKSLFRDITEALCLDESFVCLRTSNPRLYRALENCCSAVYPGKKPMPKSVRKIRDEFASHTGCEITEEGIVRGYYGGSLFYGEEPFHKGSSPFFRELGVDIHKGDALLVVGVR